MVKLEQRHIDFIKKHEGLRLKAYPDPGTGGDPWTIGYGHTSRAGPPAVKPGMKITRGEADRIFKRDIEMFSAGVLAAIKVPVNANQFGACTSLAYNIGIGGFRRSSVLRELNAGNYDRAAGKFGLWIKAGGRVMRGLVNRRAAEAAMFLEPVGDAASGDADQGRASADQVEGKPLRKSTTFWSAIGGALMNGFTAVLTLGEKQPLLAALVILVGVGFAVWIIRERRLKSIMEGV
jgi:lysozyme